MGKQLDIDTEFIHLARLSTQGNHEDVQALVRRTLRAMIKRRPELAEAAKVVMDGFANNPIARRSLSTPLPVDLDSRLELLRHEPVVRIDFAPVWPEQVGTELRATINERNFADELLNAGLTPTRSLLLVGPPGVGKTLAARWLAQELSYPLLTLDLAGVMSSFLGRTGNNIRVVLDFAQRTPSVLLLDEFDAIAKRRDDVAEIGELKRLVTVLLQAVDDWPASGLLIAATNHAELLDPAVWRRFDRIITFPMPQSAEIENLVRSSVGEEVAPETVRAFADLHLGSSFADVTRAVNGARREAVLGKQPISDVLLLAAKGRFKSRTTSERLRVARLLLESGHSQRQVSELTGVARQTLRKMPAAAAGEGEAL